MKKIFLLLIISTPLFSSAQVLGIPMGSKKIMILKALHAQNIHDTVIGSRIFILSPVKLGGHWTKNVVFDLKKNMLAQTVIFYNNSEMNIKETAELLTMKYGSPSENVGNLYAWNNVKGIRIFLNYQNQVIYLQYLFLKLHPLINEDDVNSL